jgi:phosphoribosylglycinamide formyltransferase-1
MNTDSADSKTILFLCSGGGGNLRFVHEVVKNGWIRKWSKIAVVSDRECPAVDYAKRQSFNTSLGDFSEENQNSLLDMIRIQKPDIVITTVHRVLREPILNTFKGRLLNLHYSLLPAFGGTIGTKPVIAAMNYGACLVGATVHLVTEKLDGGPPQTQIALSVGPVESTEVVMDAIFRSGCIALYTTLKKIQDPSAAQWTGGHIKIGDHSALINPAVPMPQAFSDERFWQALKK